jgi:hypothetical protein
MELSASAQFGSCEASAFTCRTRPGECAFYRNIVIVRSLGLRSTDCFILSSAYHDIYDRKSTETCQEQECRDPEATLFSPASPMVQHSDACCEASQLADNNSRLNPMKVALPPRSTRRAGRFVSRVQAAQAGAGGGDRFAGLVSGLCAPRRASSSISLRNGNSGLLPLDIRKVPAHHLVDCVEHLVTKLRSLQICFPLKIT